MALKFHEKTYEHFSLFVKALTKHDNNPRIICQHFHDTSAKFRKIFSCPVENADAVHRLYWETLIAKNKAGFYTNAALNEFEMDSNGEYTRKARFLSRVRGQIVDIDDFLSWDKIEQLISEFPPTLAVASSSKMGNYKCHFYYLYDGSEAEKIRESEYKQVHLVLAYKINDFLGYYAAERSNFSTAQAYRLPGLYHQKNPKNPFLTQIIYQSDRYFKQGELGTPEERIEAQQRYIEDKKENNHNVTGGGAHIIVTKNGEQDRLVSEYVAPASGRNTAMFNYVYHRLFLKKKLTKHEALGSALYENHIQNIPPLEEPEVVSIVESAFKKYTEDLAPEVINKMAKTGSKTILEIIQADQKQTRKELIKKKQADPDWDAKKDKTLEFDFGDRVRYTNLISDTAIIGRVAQKYKDNILCSNAIGVFSYDDKLGIWEDGHAKIPGYCMDIISRMVKDPSIYTYFYTDNGKFSQSKMNTFFKDCYSVNKLKAFTEGVKFLEEFRFDENNLDAELNLLNCKNGVIDLMTGSLLPHSPKYYMTKICDAELSVIPAIETSAHGWEHSSLWSKVIFDIMEGDIEMCLFLQRLLGYCLFGGNDKQILAFFFGQGSNGKSVIMETLGDVLGTYHATLKSEFLMMDRFASSPGKFDAFARLRGCRLVTSSELEENQRWAESTVKDITGNDKIDAKFMGKGMFSYRPQATFIVRGNNKPVITGKDRGIWRRFLTVGFDANFEENGKKDEMIFHKLRAPEVKNSILGWLVRGALEFSRLGINEPNKVRAFKEDYRLEMNPIEEFLKVCTFRTSKYDKALDLDGLWNVYSVWSKDNGKPFIDQETLATRVLQQGVKKDLVGKKDGRTMRKYNLRPRPDWEAAATRKKVVNINDALFRRGR